VGFLLGRSVESREREMERGGRERERVCSVCLVFQLASLLPSPCLLLFFEFTEAVLVRKIATKLTALTEEVVEEDAAVSVATALLQSLVHCSDLDGFKPVECRFFVVPVLAVAKCERAHAGLGLVHLTPLRSPLSLSRLAISDYCRRRLTR
jgi:hypothetical protein